jgi:hypothetical protein
MIIRTLIASAAAAGFLATAASAMTVVNADKATEYFVFTPKHGKVQHMALKLNRHVTLSCRHGGEITMGKQSQACTASTSKIWIKSGKFVI